MLKNQNIAECLFCDLKNDQFKILKPLYQPDGFKIGDGKNMKQFHIFQNEHKFGNGEGAMLDVFNVNTSFADSYLALLNNIKSLGKTLQFYSLVVPKYAVEEAKLVEFENVVGRYIVECLPECDTLVARYDFLVGEG